MHLQCSCLPVKVWPGGGTSSFPFALTGRAVDWPAESLSMGFGIVPSEALACSNGGVADAIFPVSGTLFDTVYDVNITAIVRYSIIYR